VTLDEIAQRIADQVEEAADCFTEACDTLGIDPGPAVRNLREIGAELNELVPGHLRQELRRTRRRELAAAREGKLVALGPRRDSKRRGA
jgi:hypothetical protein